MEYTIEELLEMDMLDASKEELSKIEDFVNEHYFEDERYSMLLDEVSFYMELA